MSIKHPTYIPGKGWRHETEHSMTRRMTDHDYQSRCIYMLTMSVEGRRPLLGNLVWSSSDASDAHIVPSPLGQEVERCWYAISEHYPDVEPLSFQLMPDHIHGLLFVKKEQQAHLGKIVNGFKVGCNRAYRRLILHVSCYEAVPQKTQPLSVQDASPSVHQAVGNDPKHPETGMLFSPGYQDSILMGKGQLERMFQYIADNPRRLAMKRMNPDLFRVVQALDIAGQTFAAIGNRWLLERPVRMQVRCHNKATPENLLLIARQKAYFLDRGKQGAVVVSP